MSAVSYVICWAARRAQITSSIELSLPGPHQRHVFASAPLRARLDGRPVLPGRPVPTDGLASSLGSGTGAFLAPGSAIAARSGPWVRRAEGSPTPPGHLSSALGHAPTRLPHRAYPPVPLVKLRTCWESRPVSGGLIQWLSISTPTER